MKPLAIILPFALLVAFVITGIATSFEIALALFFGWVSFLWRSWQVLTVDWPSVALAVIATLLFTAGVYWIGRNWGKQSHSQRWPLRWSVGIVAVTGVCFAAGICVVGIVHQTSWLLTDPEPMYGESVGPQNDNTMNLRLIGMATYHFADTYRSLPIAGTFRSDGTMLHGWAVEILPFMSISNKEIDMNLSWNHRRNAKYFKSVIPQFINPDLRMAPLEDKNGFGLNHYAANQHVIGPKKRMKLRDITDGTATTILIGEVNSQLRPWGHPANFRDPANGINKSPYGFGGHRNRAGAYFIMADASVKFISAEVSPSVLRALATPNGGEKVNEDWLADAP